MKKSERKEKFMPNGIPKHIRIYDNQGETADRYTVIFTYAHCFKPKDYPHGWFPVLGMSDNPFHPQGVGIHSEYTEPIDYPSYKHLGKKIKFSNLPENCQKAVIDDYTDYWNLK